jgi:hypothetical protein
VEKLLNDGLLRVGEIRHQVRLVVAAETSCELGQLYQCAKQIDDCGSTKNNTSVQNNSSAEDIFTPMQTLMHHQSCMWPKKEDKVVI